jgi:putative membrane protein
MTGFLGTAHLWVKAAHVIFVIFWMAGLFLFPRYLVHHTDALGTPEAAKWVEREELLRRMILVPSIGMVWALGIALAINLGLLESGSGLGWLHAKLVLVFALSGFQGWLVGYSKKLAKGEARLASRQLRMIGEIPAFVVIAVVILAVVRPF